MNDDAFLDALAGREPAAGDDPAAARLGTRLRGLIRRSAAVEAAQLTQEAKTAPSPDERALAERVWKRLAEEGRVGAQAPGMAPSASPASTPPTLRGLLTWLRKTLLGPGWPRGMAAAAVAAMGVLIVTPWERDPPWERLSPWSDDDRTRGAADDVIRDVRPAERQARLKAGFEAAGATVIAVQISPSPERWMLQVRLPDPGSLPAANRIRVEAGLAPTQSTVFVVVVEARGAATEPAPDASGARP